MSTFLHITIRLGEEAGEGEAINEGSYALGTAGQRQ